MKPEEIRSNYREWPKSWMGVDEDLTYGRSLLDLVTSFIESLLEKGLKKKTIRTHMDNLWLLGGEIIREVSADDEYDVPAMEKLKQMVGPNGGPFCHHLDWEVVLAAAKMKSIEVFLNFPVADMNRNVFWRSPEGVSESQIKRMNRFWGDDSWREVAYTESPQTTLFGGPKAVKSSNETIADAYRKRLNDIAGFQHVPRPVAMRNTQNAVIYYLFFASHKPVAKNIVQNIFEKYAKRRI